MLALGAACLLAGCAVPQPPGKGTLKQLVEPRTNTQYWLYLPEGYPDGDTGGTTGKRYPVVVTFHGLNPYDSAKPQARSWQQEADRYGFIVIAPKLRTCTPLMQYPVREVHPDVRKDEEAVMYILDEVIRRTDADPNHVLSTSWSAGGYFAHYIVNRHPERFSCLSIYQSNFSAEILDPRSTPQYLDMPIAIFLTENDFNESTVGSEAAIEWYRKRGFTNVQFARLKGLGHERTPELPATVFADASGAVAKSPPPFYRYQVIEQRRITPYKLPKVPPETLASTAQPRRGATLLDPDSLAAEDNDDPSSEGPRAASIRSVPDDAGTPKTRRSAPPPPEFTQVRRIKPTGEPSASPTNTTKAKKPNSTDGKSVRIASRSPGTHSVRTLPPESAGGRTQRRLPTPMPASKAEPSTDRASVRLSTLIGISPLLVSFTAELPDQIKEGADFLWTDNGIPICNEIQGQRILMEPGRHRIAVLIITKDNRELRASSDLTVLPRLTKKPLAKKD